MKRQKLIVIGNGMAGIRTVEELLKIAPDAYDITVFGAEPHCNYNRILLSPVLAGEKARRHHSQRRLLVRSQRHHPAQRTESHGDQSPATPGTHRRRHGSLL